MGRLGRYLAAAASAAAIIGAGGVAAAAAPAHATGPKAVRVQQGPQGRGLVEHPLWIRVLGVDRQDKPVLSAAAPPAGAYTPAQIRTYLGLNGDGAGETIAVVDAYNDPNITKDVATFDSYFGWQPFGQAGSTCATAPTFTKATPQGLPSNSGSWSLEISLDVEWAHAVAPCANVLLVEAASSSFANLLSAIDYAASHGAAVISNSWGASEFSGETQYDSHCDLPAAICTFSSGDSGNPGLYPGYNPYVLAVGGTTLNLTSSGAFASESAWSSSGGGVSQYETTPSYQSSVNADAGRGIPDVSYDANPNTGFAVYDSVKYQGQSGWFQVGGTSAGAPQWAAIMAGADQLRQAAGQPVLAAANLAANALVYSLPTSTSSSTPLYDVTSGSNGTCGAICDAGPGYDFVTGLGSPQPGIDSALVGVRHSVAVSPANHSGTVAPGLTVSYQYTVTNTGTASDAYSLAASSSASGWAVSVSQAALSVAAGASASVTLSVYAPPSASPGTADTATLTAVSTEYSNDSTTATASTTVPPPGVSVSPASQSATVAAGQQFGYQYTVTNTGLTSDSYSVAASSTSGWTVAASPTTLSLAAGASATVTMQVYAPSTAAAGQSDTETIALTSTLYSNDGASATATTPIQQPLVSLSPGSQTGTVAPGQSTQYQYTLTNSGNVSDTYDVAAASSSGWTVSVSPATASLSPGQTTTVTMTVTVPSTATAGASDTETLTATSTAYGDAATATATTTAANQAAFQPVSWSAFGGPRGTNNLDITLTLDVGSQPVSGATVSVTVTMPNGSTTRGSGTTGSTGQMTFTLNHAPAGTYSLKVDGVTSTPTWDGVQPANETYSKP